MSNPVATDWAPQGELGRAEAKRNAHAPEHRPADIPSLTTLRGGLAVWVVLYHFWGDVLQLFPSARVFSAFVTVGNIAVPAFFMLSGFVLAYNYADQFRQLRFNAIIRFLCLRLARIYPVHLFTLLLTVAMVWVCGKLGFQLTDSGYSVRDFLLNLVLAQTWVPDFQLNWNYPSWSISSEWFAYLMFPFAACLLMRCLVSPALAGLAALLALVAAICLGLFCRSAPFFELVLVIPTFFGGAAVYWACKGRPASRFFLGRWTPELCIVAIIACCYLLGPDAVYSVLLTLLLAMLFVLARVSGKCHKWWSMRPLIFVGEISYSLYMTHTLAQKVLYKTVPTAAFADADILTKSVLLAAYFLAVAMFCLPTYYLIEMPSRYHLRMAMRQL